MDEQTRPQWIERCARRLQFRHTVSPAEAFEIAKEMHEQLGSSMCPERAAEELFKEAAV